VQGGQFSAAKKRVGHSKHHFLFLCLSAFVLLFSIFSCGLPSAGYLYPTKGFFSSGASQIELVHNDKNIQSVNGFLGYKVYYRIFEDKNNAEESITALSELTNYNIATTAASLGYYALLKKEGTSYDPLIITHTDCESGYHIFYLNLNSAAPWDLKGDNGSPSLALLSKDGIYRSTHEDFSQKADYSAGDPDYSGTTSNPQQLYIVFFAVAYGKTSPIDEIYSNPNDETAGAHDILYDPVTYSPGR